MKQPIIYLIAAAIVIFCSNCKKNNSSPQLPIETQVGANTFGCKVNGEIWLPNGAAFTTPAYDVQYYKSDGYLYLLLNQSNTNQAIKIKMKGVFNIGIYSLDPSNVRAIEYINLHTNNNCIDYNKTNTTQTGIVEITKIDTTNKIVSGRFNGILSLISCPDINITEGRFDFEMTVYN